MMTGKDDDSGSSRADSFLGELIPQVVEHLAEQHARNFDTEADRARFMTWLAAHTKEPAAPARGATRGFRGGEHHRWRNRLAAVAAVLATLAATVGLPALLAGNRSVDAAEVTTVVLFLSFLLTGVAVGVLAMVAVYARRAHTDGREKALSGQSHGRWPYLDEDTAAVKEPDGPPSWRAHEGD